MLGVFKCSIFIAPHLTTQGTLQKWKLIYTDKVQKLAKLIRRYLFTYLEQMFLKVSSMSDEDGLELYFISVVDYLVGFL